MLAMLSLRTDVLSKGPVTHLECVGQPSPGEDSCGSNKGGNWETIQCVGLSVLFNIPVNYVDQLITPQ